MQKYTFSSEIIRECMIFSRKLNLSLAKVISTFYSSVLVRHQVPYTCVVIGAKQV